MLVVHKNLKVFPRYLGLPGSLKQLVESPASSSLLTRLLGRGITGGVAPSAAAPLQLPSPPLYFRYDSYRKNPEILSESFRTLTYFSPGTVFHRSLLKTPTQPLTSLLPALLTR